MVSIFLAAVLIYVVVGVGVGLAFVLRGVDRVDEVASGSLVVFRLIIWPGSIGLWPVVLVKWLGAGKAREGGAA